jgi:hypothetical protein
MTCRKYTSENLTLFSLGNNVLDTTASTEVVVDGEIHEIPKLS